MGTKTLPFLPLVHFSLPRFTGENMDLQIATVQLINIINKHIIHNYYYIIHKILNSIDPLLKFLRRLSYTT